jgi:flavin-dependent dehydrogenase
MPESMKRWDAVVIGGGPAGSAAALLLAKNGRQVLLLEKEATAHDKVCGEFISSDAQYYLGELGLDLASLDAAPVSNIRLMRGKKIATAALPFHAFSLSRRVLDETMLMRAQDQGVHIRRGAEVTGVVKESPGWRITVPDCDVILTDAVFLATGKHDLRGWHRQGGIQNDFIGFKMHFQLAAGQEKTLAEHIELTLFDGGYVGLELIEGGKANVCLVVAKRHFAMHGKNWDGLLCAILKTAPPLAERLAGAEPCWPRPLSIFGIPYGFVYRAPSGQQPGLYRLGDQMAVIPSFCGYGMSIALHTAFLAVECYLHGDADTYHRAARRDLLPLIRRAAFLSKMVAYPLAQNVMLLACRIRPELITSIASHSKITNLRSLQ